jgi:hypothetical protein
MSRKIHAGICGKLEQGYGIKRTNFGLLKARIVE